MMWKILTAQEREDIYYTQCSFLRNGKDAAKDTEAQQSYIDQHILNDSNTKWKTLPIAWIDYKNA